jgi:predicted nucleic acid-binding protein
LAILRASGLTVPFNDAAIATVAISLDMEVWARDKHFGNIQGLIPKLKLFQEPP